MVATDGLTVEFRLREPRGFLLSAIAAGNNIIVRKQTLEDNNFDLRRVPDYPGTGPFRFVSFESEVVWKTERNPDYWNPELPYLDGIDTFHLGFGPKTGAACLAHTIDFCFGIDPDTRSKSEDTPGLTAADILPTFAYSVVLQLQ